MLDLTPRPSVKVTQGPSIPANSEADVPVSLNLSSYYAQPGDTGPKFGIFHADYRLLSSQAGMPDPLEIQPQGETEGGRFVAENPGTARDGVARSVFATWKGTCTHHLAFSQGKC